MGEPLLVRSLILLGASVIAVALLRRLGLPTIVGYLAAGLAIGPHGFQLLAPDESTRFLAELGVVLLMFTVGLEFSLPAMMAGRGDVFGAGALQMSLTTLVAAAVAALLGADLGAALLLGGAAAVSSTAVVLKQLDERRELGTPAGRRTVGLLLFQDLASVPILVVLSAYAAGGSGSPAAVAGQVAIGGITLVAAAALGRPFFRGALGWVAQSKSAELLLLAVLLLALGAAWVAGLAGLAAPLGAFMAGMLVGESDVRHYAEDEIRPFRDVLLGLFFVTVGMQLDVQVVVAEPLAVLAWLLVFLIGKPVVLLLVARLRRWSAEEGARTALSLANGGEFGLLLVSQGLPMGLVSSSHSAPMIVALITSLTLTPVVMPRWGLVAKAVFGRRHSPAPVTEPTDELEQHVILCGCGRVGRPVAAALQAAGITYMAVESDFNRYREARARGYRVLFADASRVGVLDSVGLGRERLLVLTFGGGRESGRILAWAKERAAQAHRLASAPDEISAAELIALGADTVFPENLAAGLGLAAKALQICGLDQPVAARVITQVAARL